jgi:hypothetical protein
MQNMLPQQHDEENPALQATLSQTTSTFLGRRTVLVQLPLFLLQLRSQPSPGKPILHPPVHGRLRVGLIPLDPEQLDLPRQDLRLQSVESAAATTRDFG